MTPLSLRNGQLGSKISLPGSMVSLPGYERQPPARPAPASLLRHSGG
jgi:hypothetical protein